MSGDQHIDLQPSRSLLHATSPLSVIYRQILSAPFFFLKQKGKEKNVAALCYYFRCILFPPLASINPQMGAQLTCTVGVSDFHEASPPSPQACGYKTPKPITLQRGVEFNKRSVVIISHHSCRKSQHCVFAFTRAHCVCVNVCFFFLTPPPPMIDLVAVSITGEEHLE